MSTKHLGPERSADRRKHHVIYKTTCLVTGRYYIGMHSTDNLDDGYIGSGKRLWYSLNKYGREQHLYEIIEHLPSREALRAREAELVTEELISDPMCMNLALGGGHGWDHVNHLSGAWLGYGNFKNPNVQRLGLAAQVQMIKSDPVYAAQKRYSIKAGIDALYESGFVNGFAGKEHSASSRQKMRNARIGKCEGASNPNFGKRWVHKDGTCMQVSADQLEQHLAEGWRRGRK